MPAMTDDQLRLKSVGLRLDLLRYIVHAGAGHTGGSLSCVDILNVLYNRVLRISPESFDDPSRDRYIQSKGHPRHRISERPLKMYTLHESVANSVKLSMRVHSRQVKI